MKEGCAGGRACRTPGGKKAGTRRTIAEQRLACRKQNSIAEGAPAEPPRIAAPGNFKASSRQAWASAWAAVDASAGMGVRRYPNLDMAITVKPRSANGRPNSRPWSKPPPAPCTRSTGAPLPMSAYSIGPHGVSATRLPEETRASAATISSR